MPEIRIIAGAWRGRKLTVPPSGVRPTADKVREAWMSILQPSIPDARVLDLCSGSGALGLEALSRGAEHCDFVEQDPAVLTLLRENIATLGAASRASVHKAEALAFLRGTAASAGGEPPWTLAFADPPYRQGIAEALVTRWLSAPFATIFAVEHERDLTLPDPASGASVDRRSYGATALTFYRVTD